MAEPLTPAHRYTYRELAFRISNGNRCAIMLSPYYEIFRARYRQRQRSTRSLSHVCVITGGIGSAIALQIFVLFRLVQRPNKILKFRKIY